MTTKTDYVVLVCAVFFCGNFFASSQSVSDYAVQVTATVQTNPPAITLSWLGDPLAINFYVYRKLRDDVYWGAGTALPAGATNYVDTNVLTGTAYEYAIFKDTATYFAEGYILTGILAPLTENRGKIILLLDNSQSALLSQELARLQQDLVGDGWKVLRHDVARAVVDPANTNPICKGRNLNIPLDQLLCRASAEHPQGARPEWQQQQRAGDHRRGLRDYKTTEHRPQTTGQRDYGP
jgi:hypothetical protein